MVGPEDFSAPNARFYNIQDFHAIIQEPADRSLQTKAVLIQPLLPNGASSMPIKPLNYDMLITPYSG
jgi:hypothetical protein